MAFVNLPPNLQDMFYSITDRIAKLETGPNAAAYSAQSAQTTAQSAQSSALYSQSVATQAQIQAINAQVSANLAASQATIAQSQATIASSQATAAQTSANGKNTNRYSTSAPGTTANIVGDLWFQYGVSAPYTNKVIAQFVGAGGTTWTSMPISGLVVTNIDAGSITTGTLSAIQITAGSGATTFSVSPTGYMQANGAYIIGNITATSGTFSGSIYAGSGAFGTLSGNTLISGWSIGSNGITGVGSATITGGLISGSSINIGSGAFTVNSAGALYASSATIYGTIYASSGSFSGSVTATTGSIGGFVLSNNYIGDPSTSYGINSLNGFATFSITGVSGLISSGGVSAAGELNAQKAIPFTVTAQPNCYITTAGDIRKSSYTVPSSIRYKENITDISNVYEIDPKLLLQVPVRAFTYKDGVLPENEDRQGMQIPGFIAEELEKIYPIAVVYVDGEVETYNDRYIVPGLLALIQDQEKRIKLLEGN